MSWARPICRLPCSSGGRPRPGLRFANSCRDVVHDIHPHLLDEFDAYADAQHVNARELWQKCCRVNLKAKVSPAALAGAFLPSPQPSPQEGEGAEIAEGCSTFVQFHQSTGGEASVDERESTEASPPKVIVGRNYDYLPQQIRRQRIRFVPDCCANATIGARGGVPCGRYDGMNTHGLFASLHVVMTNTPSEDEVNPGVPFHLVVRMALELCHTAREARDLIVRMPHLSSLNYLVADSHDVFVIEADPRCVRVIENSGDILAATNHFRHPDMQPLQGGRAFANSECRLAFLSALSSLSPLSVSEMLNHAETLMADRTAPMCGSSGSLTTLWSCVAELTTKRIRYAPGAPGFVPFEEIPTLA